MEEEIARGLASGVINHFWSKLGGALFPAAALRSCPLAHLWEGRRRSAGRLVMGVRINSPFPRGQANLFSTTTTNRKAKWDRVQDLASDDEP